MPQIIHETILRDITDLLGDAKDFADSGSKALGNKKVFKSLTQTANKLILVFPVLCTKGISIETASMITKAIEKHCVNLLEMLFAAIQYNDTDDLYDYISRFHNNISVGDKITVDDFIAFTDQLESTIEAGDLRITDRAIYEQFKQGMSNINDFIKVTLNESSLTDYKCHRTYNGFETILERSGISYDKGKEERINSDKFIERLSENDIKKANELMPTKVTVRFFSKDSNRAFENAIIGVKCKLYTVDSLELIERISTKYADSNWFREIVRAGTGEISFWRDFVFALDRARVDAINSAKSGSSAKMWKVLERRATKHRLGKWKANQADSSPITTLILSQDEIEYLKKDYDVNLENRKVAIQLMDSYNFMGIFIADEPAEAVSFIWDEGNDAQYETQSFRNLERESTDKNYRKVINLMTKVMR